MAETKPLPTGEHEFEIPVVEVKKTLPASGDKKPATVLKLGLVGPNGEKGWAEFFCPDGTTPPAEGTKETLILTDDPKWGMKAARPRKGGGGMRRRDPAETRAIQRQHSQEMAIRTLALTPDSTRKLDDATLRRNIQEWTDWFDADIASGKSK